LPTGLIRFHFSAADAAEESRGRVRAHWPRAPIGGALAERR
jgi:hypothetical protein